MQIQFFQFTSNQTDELFYGTPGITFSYTSFFISLCRRHSLLSVLCSFYCYCQKYSNIDDGPRCNKIGGASCNTHVFFHFVLQEELIASKVILLPCLKLILGLSYLFAIFFLIFKKIKPTDNIGKSSQRYEMNKIKCCS